MTAMSTAQSPEPTAVEFANTRRARRGVPVELLPDAEALAAWIRDALGRELTGLLQPGDLERFTDLRDAIRSLAAAISDGLPEPAEYLAELNAAAALAPSWPELADGRAAQRTDAGQVDAALAALAASAIAVFGGPDRTRVRACGRWPVCVRFFVKNHPRRGYCSPHCANRARVSRHHERHKNDL